MTAAVVLPRSHHTRTTPATCSRTPLTCSCTCLTGLRGLPAELPELTIRTMPPRSFLTHWR